MLLTGIDINMEEYRSHPLWLLLVETARSHPLYPGLVAYVSTHLLPEHPDVTAKEVAVRLSIPLGLAVVVLDDTMAQTEGQPPGRR